MRAGGRYHAAAPLETRTARVTNREFSRGIFAWVLVISAVATIPLVPQVAGASGDALDRAASFAANFFRVNRADADRVRDAALADVGTKVQPAAPAAPVAAPRPQATPRPANAPAVQSPAQPGPAQPPARTPQPLFGIFPWLFPPAAPPSAATNAPRPTVSVTTAPQTTTAPQVTTAPQPTTAASVPPVQTVAPSVAPTAAPTAAPTVAPTVAPTTAPSVPLPATGVAAPIAPTAYAIPAGAVRVTTSADLKTALARSGATDIVVADGVYDNDGPFTNANGHRLYGASLGGALFKAGFTIGGNWGPGGAVLQGLAFNVSTSSKTLGTGIIQVWGTGKNTKILDSTFNGNSAVGSGIHITAPDGAVVRRVTVRNFTSYGVFVDSSAAGRNLAVKPVLEDIDVAGVSRAVPRSAGGTAEACIWLGNSGTLRRAKMRDCAWMGLWTGGGNTGALHEHLDVDNTPTGLYLEHFTTGSTFQRVLIGSNVEMGLVCEWDDPAWGGKPGCTDDVIQDSTFMSHKWGAFLDGGTTRVTIQRVKFIGQSKAAIYNARTAVGSVFTDNDYSAIDAGAVPVTSNR